MIYQSLTTSEFLQNHYQHIVFSGGGNRCWWQAGLVEQLQTAACWQPKDFYGVSAGAGVATAVAVGRVQDALQSAVKHFETRFTTHFFA